MIPPWPQQRRADWNGNCAVAFARHVRVRIERIARLAVEICLLPMGVNSPTKTGIYKHLRM